jgi:hypothetical protein
MKTSRILLFLFALMPLSALAEWRTESFALRAGWNAIYPHVDASHATLDTLLAAYPNVKEVWRWQPERVDPREPGNVNAAPAGVEWQVWKAGVPEEMTFDRLNANYGYLVRLEEGAPNQTFLLKGRAALPEVRWRGDGLHLAGFPVLETGTTPTFATYLAPTGFALAQAQILRYNGGPIANGVNPLAVSPSVGRITRGQAYWVRVERFSRYYGPLSAAVDSGDDVRFGTRSDTAKLVLKNETNASLTVTLGSVPSESAPNGQPTIAGVLPLLAQVDAETEFTALSTRTITLAAGAVVQVRLLPNRTAMSGVVGARFASLLHLRTTAGVVGQEMFLPATAEVASPAGLWIGEASITQVGSIVRRYQRDAAGNTLKDANGNPMMLEDLTTPGGATQLPAVTRPYKLRLIVHVNAMGQARMLSHIYQGRLAAAPPEEPMGLALLESQLDSSTLDKAVRLSVAHLPLDTNLAFNGLFTPGGSLAGDGDLVTPHSSPVNPFLHVYHPDHDNLDARFQQTLPAGRESFEIRRQIGLVFDNSRPADVPNTWGATLLSGIYQETISGITKPGSSLRIRGPFVLHKISDTAAISGL